MCATPGHIREHSKTRESQSGMAILQDLILSLPGNAPVRSVVVGQRWTVVCSRHCGLSATLRSDEMHKTTPLPDVHHLQMKSARELAELALSSNLLEASIGVAAINSLLEVDETLAAEVNASEVLARAGSGKNVALLGHFRFIPQLRRTSGQLWVIEQQPLEDEYPSEAAVDLLPQADVVAMTGCTLVNHTLDELLELCRPDATVMVLGPSTPFSPVLFHHGVKIISGTRVIDESAVLHTAGQAATLRQITGVKLLTVSQPQNH